MLNEYKPYFSNYTNNRAGAFQWFTLTTKYPLHLFDRKTYFCSAWSRLKLNIKIGLHTTNHHHPPHKLLVARRRLSPYDVVARLHLRAPMDLWQNSTPFHGAAAFAMTKIDEFRRRPSWTLSTLVLFLIYWPNKTRYLCTKVGKGWKYQPSSEGGAR